MPKMDVVKKMLGQGTPSMLCFTSSGSEIVGSIRSVFSGNWNAVLLACHSSRSLILLVYLYQLLDSLI